MLPEPSADTPEASLRRVLGDITTTNTAHCALVEDIDTFVTLFQADAERWVLPSTPEKQAEFLERATVTELAVAAHMSEVRARALILQARMIVGNLPLVLEKMRDGLISAWVASRIAEEAVTLDADVLDRFDADIVNERFDKADSAIVARVKRSAERWRTEPLETRQKRAKEHHGVRFEQADDGMSYITAFVPTDHARAVQATLTHRAKIAQAAGDPRTLLQLLADGLIEAILHGTASATAPADTNDTEHVYRGFRANVTITVPALTLMGLSDQPATMEGVGPISPGARESPRSECDVMDSRPHPPRHRGAARV